VDLEGNGVNDVVIGWSNGRLEVRSEFKGKTLFKKMLKEPIAKVVKTDFRMEG
jgi:Bardet-Biedl syndrome 2 protein